MSEVNDERFDRVRKVGRQARRRAEELSMWVTFLTENRSSSIVPYAYMYVCVCVFSNTAQKFNSNESHLYILTIAFFSAFGFFFYLFSLYFCSSLGSSRLFIYARREKNRKQTSLKYRRERAQPHQIPVSMGFFVSDFFFFFLFRFLLVVFAIISNGIRRGGNEEKKKT